LDTVVLWFGGSSYAHEHEATIVNSSVSENLGTWTRLNSPQT